MRLTFKKIQKKRSTSMLRVAVLAGIYALFASGTNLLHTDPTDTVTEKSLQSRPFNKIAGIIKVCFRSCFFYFSITSEDFTCMYRNIHMIRLHGEITMFSLNLNHLLTPRWRRNNLVGCLTNIACCGDNTYTCIFAASLQAHTYVLLNWCSNR